MSAWGSQVVVVAAAALAACEAPARVKPWRHAADPLDQGHAAPASKLLQEYQKTASPSEASATRAHTLRIHVDSDPGRLLPHPATSAWARRITFGTIFEPLLKYLSSPARYGPGLARSWQVSATGLEIRIELQPNVTFHDGRSLTALDVQFTLDAMRDPRTGNAHLRRMLDDVVAVELINSRELRVRLGRPSGWVLRALAEIPILPMHVYEGVRSTGDVLVGTGPWKWVSSKDSVVHLTRHQQYWGTAPAINDLEFVYQPDAAMALTVARRGELDILPALISAHWPEQASAPSVVAAFQPLRLMPARLHYFAFNVGRAPMDDPRVRRALALLVDRRAIAKRVFGGLARPVLWPIWPGGPVDGAEAAVPEFDPASAGKLLDDSGWLDSGKDGVRDQSGTQLRLVLIGTDSKTPKGDSTPKSERDLFVETARRAGVIVDVRSGSEAVVAQWIADGAYDVVELAWTGMSDGDIEDMVAGGGAVQADPRVAHIFDEFRVAWSPEQRSKRAPALVGALAESWPITGIVAEAPQGLIHKRVSNVRVWNGWIDLSAASLVVGAP